MQAPRPPATHRGVQGRGLGVCQEPWQGLDHRALVRGGELAQGAVACFTCLAASPSFAALFREVSPHCFLRLEALQTCLTARD